MTTVETPPIPSADDADEGVRSRSLYRAMWRWHFFAGLFAIPVIVLLCLSGLVWLFKPQIWGLMYGDLQNVTPSSQTVTYEQELAAVEKAYPGAKVSAVHTPPSATRSTIFDIATADGKDLSVYVNPYGGEVLGHRNNTTDIASIALALHGSLMTGSWLGDETYGDRFIEIVAGWSVVLLVTGTYLWWPRGKRRGLRGVLVPRFHLRGKRVLWRDVHAVTGIMFAFIALFFLVTGLAWAGVWGPNYLSVATQAVGGYPQVETNSKTVGELLPNGQSPWAMGNLPLAASQPVPAAGGRVGDELRWDPSQGAPLDAVIASTQKIGIPHGFSVTWPEDETGAYSIGYWEDGPQEPNRSATDARIAYIDQYSAEPIGEYGFDEYGWAGKATSFGIAMHEGRQWGLINQILVTIAVLAILLSVATSMVMWRKRRPKGIGAPPREPNRKLGFGLLIIIAVLGILFPLLGATILLVLLTELLVIRQVPPLARAFGVTPTRKPADGEGVRG
ncbi:MAG: PepSY-associated TM helix domain-containing protein [Pseudonocardiaceae bacterium]